MEFKIFRRFVPLSKTIFVIRFSVWLFFSGIRQNGKNFKRGTVINHLLLNLPGSDLGDNYFSEVLIYLSSVEWRNATLSFLIFL